MNRFCASVRTFGQNGVPGSSPTPVRRELQQDGRIRHWGYVDELGGRALRVITLADGITVHNACPDRDFEEEPT